MLCSEHLHNGIQYPMEQHFEHIDPGTKQRATIGLFYKLSDTEQDDPLVAKILDNAPQTFNGNTTVRDANHCP
jgi:carbonic anhydrase